MDDQWMFALAGGVLIGIAAAALFALTGRMAAVSGIVDAALQPGRSERGWRLAFLGGLLTGGVVLQLLDPTALGPSPRSLTTVIIAGLFVGFGSRLANGCTSGHGICGVARLSPRSLVATGLFIVVGAIAVASVRSLGGVG